MFIVFVVTFHIGNRLLITKARKCIDMAVGIITCQITMVKPEHTFYTQRSLYIVVYLFPRHGLVAVGCQQTCSCEQGSLAIRFNGSAFQNKVQPVLIIRARCKNTRPK
ncbi:hypothetical protein SDC9_164295 [bioreactor metagenome]|uniref:Uncharacterized protein n=1 Tax=bioreactor metagenome TaxID=1076179 RepID=A0A645FT89_9ZZZZ